MCFAQHIGVLIEDEAVHLMLRIPADNGEVGAFAVAEESIRESG
jgi:hypothetical protein